MPTLQIPVPTTTDIQIGTAILQQYDTIELTGAPGGGFNVIVSSAKPVGAFTVVNNTDQTATVKAPGGTGKTVATTVQEMLRFNGTDVALAIVTADVPTGIDAANIGDGSVSNTQYQRLPKLPYSLFDSYATVGNTTTGVTTLITNTIAAAQLAANGDKLTARYGGTTAFSATATRAWIVKFGGTTLLDSGALTLSAGSEWNIDVFIIRVSATVIRYRVVLILETSPLPAYIGCGEVTGLTLSGTNILLLTGQAGGVGAATNDIQVLLSNVMYQPAV